VRLENDKIPASDSKSSPRRGKSLSLRLIGRALQPGNAGNPQPVGCYVKAIFAGRPGQARPPGAITDADIAARLAASPALAPIFSGYPVIHDRIDSLFAGRPQAALRPDHCGASTGRILIFDPMGDIYPCNNVVGQRQHRVGTCLPMLTWDDAVQARWSARTAGRMTGLTDCKYALFCGGGCLFDAQVRHGSIAAKECDCNEFAGAFANLVRTSHARISRSGALEGGGS